jgi:hypothetical protein
MCAQGIKWNTQEKLAIGANTDADTVIAGYDNETIVGVKTETLVGGWGVGVGGLKTEVIAGGQIGAVGGLKVDYNYGQRYDYSFGYKFDRSPIGTVESVGDFWHWNKSHTMTAGTSFFVAAGETATIHAGDIAFSGKATVALVSCADSAIPTNPSATLAMTPTSAALLIGPTVKATLSLNATAALVEHPSLVNVACGAVVFIKLAPTMMQLNAATTQINGASVNLGMPPMANPALATALATLQAQSTALQEKLATTAAAQQLELATLVELLTDSIL